MEEKDYIQTDDSLYNREIKTIPKPEPNIGIDTKDKLMDDIVLALNNTNKTTLDTNEINSFSQLSQKRNETYDMLDNMFEDSKVSAMLKTYVADTVEMNDQGRIIWAESSDKNAGEYVNYLINTLNIEKNIYAWTTSLCKYGDLYIELYRQSEIEQGDKFFGGYKGKEQLNEDIKLNLYKKCDNYAHYVEMVNNPAEMFELMKFGKTVGYIQTETSTYNTVAGLTTNYYRYKFKRGDINIFPAGKFVHAALEDDVPRIPEEVTLFENTEDYDGNKDGETYKVRKGKSLFYDTYKIWRLLSLLESSILLTRLTKSNTTRVWQVELGDTPKEQVPDILNRVKTLIEQKTAIKAGESINEYASTAPYDNNIFMPQYNGQGNLTISDVGGQYNVGELPDLEYFLNALYGSRGIPKQFFGYCLRGDTKFLLLDGTTPTLKEMYDNPKKYIGKGILSCDKEGNVSPTIITEILLTRPSSDFLRITLDNGKYIDVTENHKMMLRDGTFLEACFLNVNDELMPYNEEKAIIISIERLNIQEPAYDINVQSDNHTFALPCGIFVHNCQDSAGFSGGQSLAILSSKYGKDVKRIQSVLIQLVTDIINLLLIDKNMIGYINNFKIRMQPPTTQEEIDRREYTNNKISLTRDVMDLLGDITDVSVKLNILKSMLANVITNTEVISLLQDEVEKLQKEEEEGLEPENTEKTIETIRTERESPEDENEEDLSDISRNVLNREEDEDNQPLDLDTETDISQEETNEDNLPNPSDLGLDLTSPESFDEE